MPNGGTHPLVPYVAYCIPHDNLDYTETDVVGSKL